MLTENVVKFWALAPEGRHDEPIQVKFGMEKYTRGLRSAAKFGPGQIRAGMGNPKLKIWDCVHHAGLVATRRCFRSLVIIRWHRRTTFIDLAYCYRHSSVSE